MMMSEFLARYGLSSIFVDGERKVDFYYYLVNRFENANDGKDELGNKFKNM